MWHVSGIVLLPNPDDVEDIRKKSVYYQRKSIKPNSNKVATLNASRASRIRTSIVQASKVRRPSNESINQSLLFFAVVGLNDSVTWVRMACRACSILARAKAAIILLAIPAPSAGPVGPVGLRGPAESVVPAK